MPDAVAQIAPLGVALLVILSAFTMPAAQLAARFVLRPVVDGAAAVRGRAPTLVIGAGVGAALAALLAWAWFGTFAALTVATLVLLILLATIDFAWRWLPWEWCGFLAVLGGVEAILTGQYTPAVYGALAGGGFLLALRTTYLVLRKMEALGLGDVWLAAALGCIVGPIHIIWLLAAAACLGLLLHFASNGRSGRSTGVAFGAHICLVTPFFLGL